MKKIGILIAMLFLAACGGGGSGNGGTINVTNTTPTGILNVTFTEPNTTSNAKAAAAFVPGKHFRVVVRNTSVLFNGQAFSAIQDADPNQTIGFALPVANGYTVEAIAYSTDATTGLNMMSKYAVANGVIIDRAGDSTNVTLALAPIVADLILPTTVVQGAKYNLVQKNYSTMLGRMATPLYNSWYLVKPQTASFTPFVNITSQTVYSGSNHFDAPITGGIPTNLFFQAVFTMKPTLLKAGETQKMWVFNSVEASVPVTADTNVNIQVPDASNW